MARAEDATLDLIGAFEAAKAAGLADSQLLAARTLHRKAQWRLDYIAAENSLGFHSPQESARLLAESIDCARQGHIELLKAQSGARSTER